MDTTQRVERKLAAILSADAKDYSRLMGEDEVATVRTLTAYRDIMVTLIRQHRGRVVDSPGDNLLAEFVSVVDAAQSAVAIQQELQKRNTSLPPHRRMEFRTGINLGDVIVEGDRVYGDGVNIAARLESLAQPGGICVSGSVYDQIESKLVTWRLSHEYHGERLVKNITRPVRVYQLLLDNAPLLPAPLGAQEPSAPWPRPLRLPSKPSIAVLPFVNLSDDPEQGYFSDGITEDLITDLSKLSGLFVIARNSVFLYKGKAVTLEQVSRELGVRYILEGSVRKAGTRVRITAQLIDVTTGYHLWAERYDRELQDIFAVQDEVTQKIVAALEVQLTEGEQQRLRRVSPQNLDAYEYFLHGLEAYAHRTQESNTLARQMFERAMAVDPQFAAAYAWLGRAHLIEWTFQWSKDPQGLERAFTLAQQAVALDEALPVAYQTLAYVYLMRKQYGQAIAEAEQAVALDLNNADACVTLGEILSCAGRPQEAVGLVEKAVRLDPHYPASYLFALGQAYYLTGRYEDALTAFKHLLARNPDHLRAHFFLAVTYAELGWAQEARAEMAACARLGPPESLEHMRQRIPYQDQSLLDRWIAFVRELWPQASPEELDTDPPRAHSPTLPATTTPKEPSQD